MPDWNFLGGLGDKRLEDDDADKIVDELRDADPAAIPDGRLRLVVRLTHAAMLIKSEQADVAMEELENMAQSDGRGGARRERELESRVRELEEELARENRDGRRSRAGGGARDLQKRCAMLEEDLKDLEKELNEEKRRSAEMEDKSVEAEKKAKSFKRECESLQADMKELLHQVESTQETIDKKSNEDSEFRTKMTEKNRQLLEALDENKNLSDANRDLREELEALRKQLKEATEQMDQMADQYLVISKQVEKNEERSKAMQKKNEKLETELEEVNRQLEAKSNVDEQIMMAVEDKIGEWRDLLRQKDEEVDRLKSRIQELQSTSLVRMDESQSMAAMSKAISDRDAEIQDLKNQLQRAMEDMNSSTLMIEDVKKGNLGSQKLLQRQISRVKELEKKLEENRGEFERLKTRLAEAEKDAMSKDRDLNDVTMRLKKFELGQYGLPDAIKEIKDCKRKLNQQEEIIEEMAKDANRCELVVSELAEENESMREKLGLQMDKPLDLTSFKMKKIRQNQEDKAVNAILKSEIERLEEERLDLKNQIRRLAQSVGGKAAALGLDSNDLLLLDKYAEELKTKKSNSGLDYQSKTHDVKAGISKELELLKKQNDKFTQDKKLYDLKFEELQKERTDILKKYEDVQEANRKLLKQLSASASETKTEASQQIGSKNINYKTEWEQAERQVSELHRQLKELRLELTVSEKERNLLENKIEKLTSDLKVNKSERDSGKTLPVIQSSSSSEIIHLLNEKLLNALNEINVKNEAIERLEAQLNPLKHRYNVCRQKLVVMSKQCLEKIDSQRSQEDFLKNEPEKETEGVKIIEYERLLDTLDKDDDEIKRRLADLSRKVTLLRVNEKILTRKFTLVQESEEVCQRTLQSYHSELSELKKSFSEKFCSISKHKELGDIRISALQRALAESIPAGEIEKLQKDYYSLAEKYREAMENEKTLMEKNITNQNLIDNNKILSDSLVHLKKELELEKCKRLKLEEYLGEQGVKVSGELALNVEKFNEKSVNYADRTFECQKQYLRSVEERNVELEINYANISKLNVELRNTESSLREELLHSISKKEKEKLLKEKEVSDKLISDLRNELSCLKETSDIAFSQLEHLKHWQSKDDTTLLKNNLLDLQSLSEDNMVVGKLQNYIALLQSNEAIAVEKLKDSERTINSLWTKITLAEKKIEDQNKLMFQIRQDTTFQIRQLKQTVFQFRRMYSGCISLKEQERYNKKINEINIRNKYYAEQLQTLSKEFEELKTTYDQVTIKNELTEEVSIKKKGGASDHLEQLVKGWQTRVETLQVYERKHTREISGLKEENEYLTKVLHSREKDIVELEEEILKLTKSWEDQAIRNSCEENISVTETQIQELSAAQISKQILNGIPHMNLPIGDQLNQAVETIKLQLKNVNESKEKIGQLENELLEKNFKLRTAEKIITLREKVIAELRQHIPASVDVSELLTDSNVSKNAPPQNNSDAAMAVAKMKIETLESELIQKEHWISKLERKLNIVKQSQEVTNKNHQIEKENLLSKVKDIQSYNIDRVKKSVEINSEMSGAKKIQIEQNIARLTELENLVVEQDLSLANMAAKMNHLKTENDQKINELQLTIVEKQKNMQEIKFKLDLVEKEKLAMQNQVEEYRLKSAELEKKVIHSQGIEERLTIALKENEVLSNEKTEAKQLISVIEKLKSEISTKDSQQKALSKALINLRSDMVESAEEKIKNLDALSRNEINIQEIIEKAIEEYKRKNKDLTEKNDALNQELQTIKLKNQEIEKNYEVIANRDTEIIKLRIQNEQLMKQLKVKSDLFKENSELKRKMALLEEKLSTTYPAEKPYDTHSGLEGRQQKTQAAYQQWEGKKRQQLQIDKLKKKLNEKEAYCAQLDSKLETQKSLLQRAEKEKMSLETKFKQVNLKLNRIVIDKEENKDLYDLKATNHQLKETIDELQNLVKDNEQKEFTIGCLKERIIELEQRVEYLVKNIKNENNSETDNYGRILVVLESFNRESELHGELLNLNKEILDLRFLVEKQKQTPIRLKERITDLENYVPALKTEISELQNKLEAAKESPDIASARSTGSGVRRVGESSRSNVELEKTIFALKKVIEKLEKENEGLKKSSGIVNQDNLLMLQKENEGLKKMMEELQLKVGASLSERYEATQLGKEKIQAENNKLNEDLKALHDESNRLKEKLLSFKQKNMNQERQIMDLKEKLEEEKVRMSHKEGGTDQSRNVAVSRMYEQKIKNLEETLLSKEEKLKQVTQDNKLLKEELSGFDPAFFEEIEDLKYNYKQSIERNIQLEEILAKLIQKYNIPLDMSSL